MSSAIEVKNPFTGKTVTSYEFDSRESVDCDIASLKAGRDAWRLKPAFEKSEVFTRLADLMAANKQELATLVTEEAGKTIRDSLVEIDRAVATIRCSAEEVRRMNGELLSSDGFPPARNKTGMVFWRPLGVVLAITPFNFPINIACHKIGPALAAGNTVLFKPHPQNIKSSSFWMKLCYEAGIPREALLMSLMGIPEVEYATSHKDIAFINFTGGVAAGLAIQKKAYDKKVLLELGGNDPLIVMPDGDIKVAVNATISQRFGTAGQRCTAAKRVFVHKAVFSEFSELLVEATEKLVVGDPSKIETDVGPLIYSTAADQVMAAIEDAIQKGATLLIGNKREGNVVYPTVLSHPPKTANLLSEEVFGPVVPLCEFEEINEVIDFVNAGDFGLQAGLFTQQLDVIQNTFDRLEVGTLAINDGPGFRAEHFPFGGVKHSGVGKEGVAYAMREMSQLKTLVL